MRNYYYLATERINGIYNQMNASTPVEIIREQLNKKGILTDWKANLEGGIPIFVKGGGGFSKTQNIEQSFTGRIRSTVELEQKVDTIEKTINFTYIEQFIGQNQTIVGFPIRFSGVYYSKGLKSQDYYSSVEWDGTLPFLYKNIKGIKIRVVYNPLHFVSKTVWANVHGRFSVDGIGFVTNQNSSEVIITPIAFGLLISDELTSLLG